MLRYVIALGAMLITLPVASHATPRENALLNAVGIERMLELMREEGLVYGEALAEDFLGREGGRAWEIAVSDIYDLERMRTLLQDGFAESFDDDMLPALEAFYGSETGTEIVALELAAREAFLDKDLEEATKARLPDIEDQEPEAFARVAEFIELNDLVDQNVVGALNSNYAFMVGLVNGGGFPGDLSQQDMLADVWSQEAEIRQNTTEWLFAYLLTAYLPLDPEAMDAYLDLSRSEEGRAFTRALFVGFDEMFVEISHDLGAATSRFMMTQEL